MSRWHLYRFTPKFLSAVEGSESRYGRWNPPRPLTHTLGERDFADPVVPDTHTHTHTGDHTFTFIERVDERVRLYLSLKKGEKGEKGNREKRRKQTEKERKRKRDRKKERERD